MMWIPRSIKFDQGTLIVGLSINCYEELLFDGIDVKTLMWIFAHVISSFFVPTVILASPSSIVIIMHERHEQHFFSDL